MTRVNVCRVVVVEWAIRFLKLPKLTQELFQDYKWVGVTVCTFVVDFKRTHDMRLS